MKRFLSVVLLCLLINATYTVYPQGIKVEITIEHQMIPEKDTIFVRQYHKVENKFYLITLDSTDLWVDNVRELK
jgi:hypothetical protein